MKTIKITLLKKVFICFFAFFSTIGFSQIGFGTNEPSSLSSLDIRNTEKGLLIPRLTTTERTTLGATLTTAANSINKGMQVFDTDTNSVWFWNGTAWLEVADKTRVSTSFKPVLENTIANSASITAIGRYIVPATGVLGGFIGQANKYADYNGTSFTYSTPATNEKVTIQGGTNIGVQYTYSGSAWVKIGQDTPLPTDNYLQANAYNAGDIVVRNNKIYQANAAIPANTAFAIGTTTNWKKISAIPEWAQSGVYEIEDVVKRSGMLYEANSNIPTNTAFAIGNSGATWKALGGTSEFGEVLPSSMFDGQSTGSTSFVDVSGSAFTLPSAGTYEVTYTLTAYNNSLNFGQFILAESNSTQVPRSSFTLAPINGYQTITRTVRVSTSAAKTYKIMFSVTGGLCYLSTGDRAGIIWKKISN